MKFKLNGRFFRLKIRNDLSSPGSGIHVFEQMLLCCLASLHDEMCPSSAPLWSHVTASSSEKLLKSFRCVSFQKEGKEM